jgi:FkbM family methyltransferase
MGWRSDLLQRLPPRVSMPVRARLGFSREPEMAVLPSFVRRGEHCLDIGCHLGIYAYQMLRLVGPTGSVTGFEPQTVLADYLQTAFAPEIAAGRFTLRRSALGEQPGNATLTLPDEHGRLNRGRATLLKDSDAHGETLTVPVEQLDQLDLRRPVSFVKCDVEGFELHVLRGGSGLLQADGPTLLVEIEQQHAGSRAQETFGLLWDMGYTCAVLRDKQSPLAVLTRGDRDPAGTAAGWAERYVYNYLFVAPGRSEALASSRVLPSRK